MSDTMIELSADLPSYNDTYALARDMLGSIIAGAMRDADRQIEEIKDTASLDWDELSSDDLLNRHQEYLRLRYIQDRLDEMANWIKDIPPF